MTRANRDDFLLSVKRVLADRVGHRCSNPDCRQNTSAPNTDPNSSTSIGVAAHITAAARGGPRFNAILSQEERRAAGNGIWLCQNCAKLIDSDEAAYDELRLREWKASAEAEQEERVARPRGEEDSARPPIPERGQGGQSWIPPSFVDALESELIQGDRATFLLAKLAEKTEIGRTWDAAWPGAVPWPHAIAYALAELVRDKAVPSLRSGELFTALAVPFLIASVWKSRVETLFDTKEQSESDQAEFSRFLAENPMFERATRSSDSSFRLVGRAAATRHLNRSRRRWPDSVIESASPGGLLSDALTNNGFALTLVRAIGGAQDQFESLPEESPLRVGDTSFSLRWKLLACVVTLAEHRLVTAGAIPTEVLEHAVSTAEIAELIQNHIGRVVVSTNDDCRWSISVECDEPLVDHCVDLIAQEFTIELRSRRRAMADYVASLRCPFPVVAANVSARLVNGRPRYTKPHVTFSLSTAHARRLLTGQGLWGDSALAYREMFQNALDACRIKAARMAALGLEYSPVIRIHQGKSADGRVYVECEDNGIGMDRGLIATCFAKAGSRFVDTEEYRRERDVWTAKGVEHHVNSRFGIGVFSYFLVAESIEVETSRASTNGTESSEPILVTIPTAASFFRIVGLQPSEVLARAEARREQRGDPPSRGPGSGTIIRLYLRNSSVDRFAAPNDPVSCVDALRRRVWLSEVPVKVTDDRGNELALAAGKLTPPEVTEVGVAGSHFWWLPQSGSLVRRARGTPLDTWRSRSSKYRKAQGGYRTLGRILVDGVATDMTTPGFVVNFPGECAPELSVDRLEVRADMRSRLFACVVQGCNFLPKVVSGELLEDLWYWDPRVCHLATRCHDGTPRHWRAVDFFRTHDLHRPVYDTRKRGYFPEHLLPDGIGRLTTTTTKVLHLWRTANDSPDARQLSRFVLDQRGLGDVDPKHFARVPEVIWSRFRQVSLGVPEAAALEYGLGSGDSAPLLAYMSWLSGESLAICGKRLNVLLELVGEEPCTVPTQEAVVEDREAWLLSGCNMRTPWLCPPIRTVDVLRSATMGGSSFAILAPEYDALAKRLGWASNIDVKHGTSISELSQKESAALSRLEDGRPILDEPELNADRRASLARLVDREWPEPTCRPRESPESGALTEDDRHIRKLLCLRQVGRTVTLAVACGIAREIGGEIRDALSRVSDVALGLGFSPEWGEADVSAVAEFREEEWSLFERERWFGGRTIRARTQQDLLALLAGRRYAWRDVDAGTIVARVRRGCELFGWEVPELQTEQVGHALALSYKEAELLRATPRSGRFSVAHVLTAAASEDRSIGEIIQRIAQLSFAGVDGPTKEELYLGVRWGDVVED